MSSHRYAAVIGIDNYSNGVMPLQTAVNDARTVAQCLERDHGYEVDLLIDEQAKLSNLLDLIEEDLFDRVTEDTTFLLYFAGHAFADGDALDPEGFFFPQDSQKGVESSWLPMKTVSSVLEELPCKHLLLVLDCCFAGSFRWATSRAIVPLGKPLYDQQLQRYLNGEAWHLLTSSAHNETAVDLLTSPQSPELDPEAETTRHSPFAAALLAGLRGEADSEQGGFQSDGVITVTELHQYICNRFQTSRETRFQTPGLSNLKRANRGQFVFRAPGQEENTLPSPELNEDDNPWLGLSPYTREDSEKFFGRGEVIEGLLRQVSGERAASTLPQEKPGKYAGWTVVIGASGSGKSSVVRAGLIPKLLSKEPEPWHVEMMPRLSSANPVHLLEKIAVKLAAVGKTKPKLLVIDQFEEIFSQNTLAVAVRAPFFERLIGLVNSSEHLHLVLTVRSDFEPQMRSVAAFGREIAQAFFPVPQPNALELRQIVEGPAELQDLYFDPPELVSKITQDVLAMPGALPMISFALAEMYRTAWQRRFAEGHSRAITQEDFDDVGGVVGSLHNRANRLWDAPSSTTEQDLATKRDMIRWIFLRMVSDEGGRLSRRRVVREELQRPTLRENRMVEEVLLEYSQARLLIRDDGYYEPGHDALVVAWPRLLRWLEVSHTQPLLRALWDSASAWREETEKRAKLGHLWTENPRLSLVKNLSTRLQRLRQRIFDPDAGEQIRKANKQRQARLQELNALELQFVEASTREVRKRADKNLLFRSVIYVCIFVFGYYIWHQSNEFQRIAEVAESRLQIASAGSLLDQGETDLAALVALELDNPRHDSNAARILHQALFEHLPEQSRLASLDTTKDPTSRALWSPEGLWVLVVGRSGQMHLWNPHEPNRDLIPIASSQTTRTAVNALRAVAWSPDGERIAAVNRQAELHILKDLSYPRPSPWWSTETKVKLPTAAGDLCEPNDFTTIEWHPEDPRLFVVYQGEAPLIWDAETKALTPSLGPAADESPPPSQAFINSFLSAPILSAGWDARGEQLLVVTRDSAVRWRVGEEEPTTLNLEQPIVGGLWSPTGEHAMLATAHSVQLWNESDDQLTELFSKPPNTHNPKAERRDKLLPTLGTPEPSEDPIRATWSPDGTRLLLAWRDEGLLWSLKQYYELRRFGLGGRDITGLAWSPLGDQLIESSAASVSIWDMQEHNGLASLNTSDTVLGATWSPDGERVLTATAGSLDVWPVAPEMVQALLMQELKKCLVPQEREQYLQELSEEATDKAEACERCTPLFFESLDPSRDSEAPKTYGPERLNTAWDAYRQCLEKPVENPWERSGAEQIETEDSDDVETTDPICRARFQGDLIPGQWQLQGDRLVCLFAPPRNSESDLISSFRGPRPSQHSFEVLDGKYAWNRDLQRLDDAMVGGRQGTQALYICRGRIGNQVRIGKWIDGACWAGQIMPVSSVFLPIEISTLVPMEVKEDLELLNAAETGWLSWVSQLLPPE